MNCRYMLIGSLLGGMLVGGGTGYVMDDRADRAEARIEQEHDAAVKARAEADAAKAAQRRAEADAEDAQRRLAEAAERERAAKVRASRARRVTEPLPDRVRGGGDDATYESSTATTGGWAHSVRGIKIANCESADLKHWPYSDGTRYLGGEKGVHMRAANGHYGKWQFDLSTWRSVGGTGNPADASEAEQDARANRLYAARREQPWACARMV